MEHEKIVSDNIVSGFKPNLASCPASQNCEGKSSDAGAGQKKPAMGTCSPNSPTEVTAEQVRNWVEGFIAIDVIKDRSSESGALLHYCFDVREKVYKTFCIPSEILDK